MKISEFYKSEMSIKKIILVAELEFWKGGPGIGCIFQCDMFYAYLSEGSCHFPMGNNDEIAKIHWIN